MTMSFNDPTYVEWENHLRQMFRECPLTWVPAMLKVTMEAAKDRSAFSETGMEMLAKRVQGEARHTGGARR